VHLAAHGLNLALGDHVTVLNVDATYLVLAMATVIVNAASMLQSSELMGYQRFRSLATAQCCRGIALPPLCAAGAVTFGLSGVIFGAAAATGVGVILQAVAVRRERVSHGVTLLWPDRRDTRAVLSRSIPAFIAGMAQGAGYWGGTAIIASRRADGMSAVGAYGAANQVTNIILFLPNIIGQVLMATVANRKASSPEESRRLVRLSFALNTGAATLFAGIAIVFREPIALLFGSRYSEASATLALMAFGSVIWVAQGTFAMALMGYGRIRTVTVANILAALTFIGTTALLNLHAPHAASQCLGWAYIASSTVQLLVNGGCLFGAVYSSRPVLLPAPDSSV
jgi:O-antigen/teichoic acid export membrane protein